MTEIRFYHMEQKTLDQALPEILGKATSGGRNVVVMVADERAAQHLNAHLWTFAAESFLPHGTVKEGNAADQPIWITTEDENPNSADVLILTGGVTSGKLSDYALCCEMLDGRNPDAIKDARARWKEYKEQGFELNYWQQSPQGKWEKKA